VSRQRDSQRSKVYAAERVAFGTSFHQEALTWDETNAFILKVQDSAHWKKLTGSNSHRPIRVKSGKSNWSATASYATLTLPKWARNKGVILHELAHTAHARYEGDYTVRQEAAHGWRFCSIYIGLVQHFIGKDAADNLKAAFKAGKVKYTAPRAKRQLTDEQKAAGAARLAAARAARPKNPWVIEHEHKVNYKESYHHFPHSFDVVVRSSDDSIAPETFFENSVGWARKGGEKRAKAQAERSPGSYVTVTITPDNWHTPRYGIDRRDCIDVKTYSYQPDREVASV
jgi:hypothetical protein